MHILLIIANNNTSVSRALAQEPSLVCLEDKRLFAFALFASPPPWLAALRLLFRALVCAPPLLCCCAALPFASLIFKCRFGAWAHLPGSDDEVVSSRF